MDRRLPLAGLLDSVARPGGDFVDVGKLNSLQPQRAAVVIRVYKVV